MGLTYNRKQILLKNDAKSTLSSNISSSDTTITVANGEGSKFPSITNPNEYFYVTIQSQTNDNQKEIVKVISTSNDTFTVERGQENTTPQDFVAGDYVELRVTKQLLEDVSYIDIQYEPEYRRVYYDTLILSIETMNTKLPSSFNANMAPSILNIWDSYLGSKVKNVIYNITGNSKVEDDIVFSTKNEINTYVNNNVPVNNSKYSETWVMQPYDEIDDKILVPMAYPFNRFYGSLKERTNYMRYFNHYGKVPQGYQTSKLAKIFNYYFGTSNTTLSDSEKRVIWLPSNKNLYKLPSSSLAYAVKISSTGNSPRAYRNVSDQSIDSVTSDSYFRIIAERVAGLNLGNSNVAIFSQLNAAAPSVAREYSFIWIAYLQNTVDSSKRAIYIKPFGIDTLMFYPIDFSKYTLELLLMNSNKYESMTKILHFEQLSDMGAHLLLQDPYSKKFVMDIRYYYYTLVNEQFTNNSREPYPRIYFRLRDKTTNKVSNLSKFYVTLEDTPFGIPSLIVKHDR